jgi:hypothetical protein
MAFIDDISTSCGDLYPKYSPNIRHYVVICNRSVISVYPSFDLHRGTVLVGDQVMGGSDKAQAYDVHLRDGVPEVVSIYAMERHSVRFQ